MTGVTSDTPAAPPAEATEKPGLPRRAGGPVALWVVPVALLVVLPGLYHEWVLVIHAFRSVRFAVVTAIVAMVAAVLAGTVWLGNGRRPRQALAVTAASILAIFMWPLYAAVATAVGEWSGLQLLGDASAVLLAWLGIFMAVRMGEETSFAVAIAVGSAAAVLAVAAGVAGRVALPDPVPMGAAQPGAPDVVVIVLDEYGRSDVFQEVFGFSNQPFLEELERRGFTASDRATSNYNNTYASVSSMLDLGYAFDAGPIGDDDWEAMRLRLSGGNRLFDVYHEHGYRIMSFENPWGGSNCTSAADRCVRDGIVVAGAWWLGRSTILRDLTTRFVPNPFPYQGREQLERLGDLVAGWDDGSPHLVFAHSVLPHGPYQLNADCTFDLGGAVASAVTPPDGDARVTGEAIAAQVACTNRLVLAAVDRIIEERPDTIFVITGDHGPAPVPFVDGTPAQDQASAIWSRFGILLATRLPDWCQAGLGVDTPVNAIRAATVCALGADLAPLPDRWFVTPAEAGATVGSVVEVTYPEAGAPLLPSRHP